MNVGGPAYHVSLLSGRLAPDRYESLLVTGALGPGEASLANLAEREGAAVVHVPSLGPELDPRRDRRAMRSLVRLMRDFRPDVVHTHTAKAGAIGRPAARIALGGRPVVIHTYHGHVLRRYFGPARTTFYRGVETALASLTDRLIGVSQATVDELVALRVAPRRKFTVIPLGLDLTRFLTARREAGAAFRAEMDAGPGDCLALFVGRLVPIKRVDIALRAVVTARLAGAPIRLAIVGDGELRDRLERLAADLRLGSHVRFLGFRHDLDRLTAGCDVAVLSSDNEGTPVALIEAAAAARPAVATEVGGVPDIVNAETGRLVPARDVDAFAAALVELASDRGACERLGAAARRHVRAAYAAERLLDDIDRLYTGLLSERGT